jgi:drug/metabolite transporter (DMT)-like permease
VRLSLATIAAIALNAESLEEAVRATHGDSDVAALFHMAMQCQIIDDVIDYKEDLSAGLPSFLTASASLPQAVALTAEAAQSYSTSHGVFPLRVALSVITSVARLVVRVARRGEEMKTMVLIVGAVAFSATGQLCLKSGAQRLAGLGGLEFLLAATRDTHVLSGLAAWISSTLCWLYVLRVAPLSKAYGLYSFTYVLVPLVSVFVFGEHLRRSHIVGIVLITMGIACVLASD